MARPYVNIGPLRTSVGLADVRFDGVWLRLTRYSNPLAVIDRYRLVIVVGMVVLLIAAGYVSPASVPVALVVAGLAGACLLALLVLVLTELSLLVAALGWGVLSVVSTAGRGRIREVLGGSSSPRAGRVHAVAERDIHLMDPVHGAWRATLVLHTSTGELRLSGWWWRRRQLERLQRQLGRDDG